MVEWVTGHVVRVKHWTKNLFSLIVHAPIDPFTAGQFAKLKLEINSKNVQRAYSYVNSPHSTDLEFYIVTVPNGKLSLSLHSLMPGDSLLITKKAAGFFVLSEIPSCANLWMLATGTGIGPYLSILEHGKGLERFKQIILVHATRFARELNYLPKMLKLQQHYKDKLRIQTIVSREKVSCSLNGRIPSLISDGSLEAAVDLQLETKSSHIMLCGNPQMLRDTQQILKDTRGMRKHLKRKPGHITSEHYW